MRLHHNVFLQHRYRQQFDLMSLVAVHHETFELLNFLFESLELGRVTYICLR